MPRVRDLESADYEQVLDEEKREVFEQIIARYEKDWHKDPSTRWQDYLPEDSQLRACLIAELPEIEAEFEASKPGERTVLDSARERQTSAAEIKADSTKNENSLAKERAFRAEVHYKQAIREIRGGLGDVFVIKDVELNRVVVVKQLQARWLGNERARRAFQREVKITSLLEHPCVVPVHSVGTTTDGRPFYSMRFVDGQTLQQAIDSLHKSSSFDRNLFRSLVTHFIQICKAIAYANSCGIIHRDLKPSNIIIGQFGQTMVLDWGLAKQLHTIGRQQQPNVIDQTSDPNCIVQSRASDGEVIDDEDLYFSIDSVGEPTHCSGTSMGDIVGTPAYMSPEQALGETNQYSIRTDVFGLGSVLFAILAGRPPYIGRDTAETISLAAESSADFSLIKDRDSLTRGLIAICRKAMHRDSNMRYPDAQSLADDLESWLAGENIAIQSQPFLHRLGRIATRQRTLASVAVLLLLATVATIILGVQAVQAEKTRALLVENESKANFRATKNVAEYVARVYRNTDPVRFDDPGFSGNGNTNARAMLYSILDSGYQLVHSEIQNHPEPHSDLLLSVGSSYRGVGEYGRARELLTKAWDIRRELYGENDVRTLECKYQFACLEYEEGFYEQSERMLRELIRTINGIRISTKPPFESHFYRELDLLAANARYQLAWLQFFQPLSLTMPQFDSERVAESQRMFREVIQLRSSVLPKNDRSIGMAYAGLAASLFCSPGKEKEAMLATGAAMEIFGHGQPDKSIGNFVIEYNKAERLRLDRKFEEAERQYLKLTLFISDQVGEAHPLMAIHRWNMAGFYLSFDQMQKAESMILAVRESARNIPAVRSSPLHLDGLKQYADALVERNRQGEAAELYSEILRLAQERTDQNADLIHYVQNKLEEMKVSKDSVSASSTNN